MKRPVGIFVHYDRQSVPSGAALYWEDVEELTPEDLSGATGHSLVLRLWMCIVLSLPLEWRWAAMPMPRDDPAWQYQITYRPA